MADYEFWARHSANLTVPKHEEDCSANFTVQNKGTLELSANFTSQDIKELSANFGVTTASCSGNFKIENVPAYEEYSANFDLNQQAVEHSASFICYTEAVARMVERLTTPYNKEIGGSPWKLLSIEGLQLDVLYRTLEEVLSAHHVETAEGDSLDLIGTLLSLERYSDETDVPYRRRLMEALNSTIGGGTKAQLMKVIQTVVPSAKEPYSSIQDLYSTDEHTPGNPTGHYAHIKVNLSMDQISAGGDVVDWSALKRELEKWKAAAITIDELNLYKPESQPSGDEFKTYEELRIMWEVQPQSDVLELTFLGVAGDETQTQSEPYNPVTFRVGYSETESLNPIG